METDSPSRFWTAAGAALAFAGVALGAFGAHGLKEMLVETGRLATYETAVLYHLVHALAVFALGLRGGEGIGLPAKLLAAGVLIFSGSLYLLCVTGAKWLGAVTPFGGVAFLAGWGVLAWRGWRGSL
jgi:uncharacterized membrane protein YgdD (TMEM256/DUF423 family)